MNVYDYDLDLNGEVGFGIEVDGVDFFIKKSNNPEFVKEWKMLNEDRFYLDICSYFHKLFIHNHLDEVKIFEPYLGVSSMQEPYYPTIKDGLAIFHVWIVRKVLETLLSIPQL